MSSSSFSSSTSDGATSPTSIQTDPDPVLRNATPVSDVGADRQRVLEDELDARIKAADSRGVHLKAKGDEAGWRAAIRQMHELIASRSPEHQERLAREAWERQQRELDEGVDYFQVQGRLSRARAAGGL